MCYSTKSKKTKSFILLAIHITFCFHPLSWACASLNKFVSYTKWCVQISGGQVVECWPGQSY